ncbi:uncharacterized protein LOC117903420 [Drosophila subobscura]|uniref:uncharacterized protein LOC117903420 n=1 Tax=Drosophila subobscura TaxID=7241 RepID=UPI00155A4EC5|nr:uncharacterized protein LOC117903420 [Drosophila subobscura]
MEQHHPMAHFWFVRNMDIIMRICLGDPLESAVQSFVLNPPEEDDPATLHFLMRITDLKKRFNQANEQCFSLEREYPTPNSFLLHQRLDANFQTLKREARDVARDMQRHHITAHVV